MVLININVKNVNSNALTIQINENFYSYKKLDALYREHGDLSCFDQDMYSVISINLCEKDIEEPPHKMPNFWVSILTTR